MSFFYLLQMLYLEVQAFLGHLKKRQCVNSSSAVSFSRGKFLESLETLRTYFARGSHICLSLFKPSRCRGMNLCSFIKLADRNFTIGLSGQLRENCLRELWRKGPLVGNNKKQLSENFPTRPISVKKPLKIWVTHALKMKWKMQSGKSLNREELLLLHSMYVL